MVDAGEDMSIGHGKSTKFSVAAHKTRDRKVAAQLPAVMKRSLDSTTAVMKRSLDGKLQ